MSQRQVIFTGTLVDAASNPIPGAPVSATVNVPNSGNPLDGNGALVSVMTVTTTANGSGVYALTVDYTPDFTTAGCSITINENGLLTYIPVSYTYASTYATSAFYTSTAAAGTLLVYADIFTLSDTAVPGDVGTITLSQTGIGPAGQFLSAGTPISAKSDSGGRFRWNILPNASIMPTGTTYKLSIAGEPSSFVFTVPAAPTGYQGAYSGGTTYHANAGTKLSPADVVLSGGVLYQAIATTTGNAPPNATYWRVWPGEPLTWWITFTQTAGGFQIDETGVRADAAVATGTYAVPPVTLQDQLRQLTQIQARHVTAATDTATYDDDVLDLDGTANAVTETLPTAVGWTKFLLLKCRNITHAVTVGTTSAQTIDGASTLTPALNVAYLLYSNGSNWQIGATANIGGGGGATPAAVLAAALLTASASFR
jgi:hypothetical protein